MTFCPCCNTEVGNDFVQCSQCKNEYHFACVPVTESQYRKWNKQKKLTWRCSLLCAVKTTSNTVDTPDTFLCFSPEKVIPQSANPTMAEMCVQIKELCGVVASLKESIEFQSLKFDDFVTKLAQQDELIKNHERTIMQQAEKIGNLEEQNKKLTFDLNGAMREIGVLDQYSRNRNIEIHGIQERKGENLTDLVQDLAHKLQIPFDPADIDVAHRLPSKPNKRKAIIIQFQRRSVRNLWLRKRNTGLVSNNIVGGSDDEKIYVNVNLSAKRKELLWRARMAGKSLNFKVCRPNDNGDIIMKRSLESQPIIIRSVHDLPLK